MILDQSIFDPTPVACDGLLVIGDPHLGSRRPGRRKDGDWPAPILAKLERCVAIANARNLAPVILGDIFERAVEPDESLKARLIRLLKAFRIRPLANVGNHDIAHTRLSDGDSLAVLGLCDVLDVVAMSGPVRMFTIGGRRLGVGMTPYGQAIPTDVRGLLPDAATVAWFTHHDIAFDGAYPGAVPPFPIAGCDLVVNGHIHTTNRPIRAGATLWTNPGNIARQSVDLLDHVPRAWVLDADGRLEPEALPHAADVFDLTGRVVEAAGDRAVAAAVESAFVSLLQAEASTDVARSDDGSLLAEEIVAKFTRDDTPEAVRAVVRSLLAEAVERRAG
jgi:hypothetical protein